MVADTETRAMSSAPSDVTTLMSAAAADRGAADRLLALVYDQLRKVAQQRMNAERPDHSLEATALVHEAYLRLAGDQDAQWVNRAHFFKAAGEAMRRILIEHARARGCVKRGGDQRGKRLPLKVLDLATEADLDEILSVDDAVRRLEEQDPDLAQIVRLRFYAGLSEDETARCLGVSDRTVRRDWTLARAWLKSAVEGSA